MAIMQVLLVLLFEKRTNLNTKILILLQNGGKLVQSQNAQYNVIQEYNKKAKNQIELTESESFLLLMPMLGFEGRYDAYFSIKLSFEEAVQKEDGAIISTLINNLVHIRIETYPIHKIQLTRICKRGNVVKNCRKTVRLQNFRNTLEKMSLVM